MEEFFDNLYNRHKETIYNYILVSLGFNYDLANDCMQDVFVLLLEKKEILSSHPNPGGFFTVTARNYIKRYKAEQYNYAKKIMPLEDKGLICHDDFQNIHENLPDTEILKSAILQRLNQKEMQLYELFYEQQFSVSDISKRLNIKESNTKVRLFRLRLKVRELIRETFK